MPWRAGDAVARTDDARSRSGVAASEQHGGEAPERNAAGEDRVGEERPKQSRPQELTLKVGGISSSTSSISLNQTTSSSSDRSSADVSR